MDNIDRRILTILRYNARQPLKSIAGQVGLARSSVAARIARLERDGVITGYRAEVVPERLGSAGAMVLLELGSTPDPGVVAAVCGDLNVDRCYSLSGEIDLLVEISVADSDGINQTRDRLSSLAGVTRARTALILKRDKG